MGTASERSCAHCGAALSSATAKFCAECGWSIGQRGPGRNASGEPAKERKFVTVVFADIKGSTEVAQSLDPEDWFLALERFHAAATGSIHRFGGVVTLYAGDGVMALFGAPIAHENHAAQACWAALRLTEQVGAIAGDLAQTIGARLGVRIGINSGMVVVGGIGESTRVDYTAQGLPVHIAARMEQIAEVGEIFLAPSTAALVADRFDLAPVGDRVVKGIAEPIRVHRLLGPAAAASRAGGVRSTRHGAPFVGRDAEVAILRAALADARAGRAPVVGISAPAGFGKSRLLHEFVEELEAQGSDVVGISGDAVGVPGERSAVDELVAKLVEPGAQPETLDAVSLRALVERRADVAADALVICIDDVHVLDRISRSMLAALLAAPFRARVLFVVTSRSRAGLAAVAPDDALVIYLESLRLEETEQVVQEWLGAAGELQEVASYLHERSGGNPFFVYETLRALLDGGHLVGPLGACRLSGPLEASTVPTRIHMVIASRIDHLDRDQRDLLHSAAVIGAEFDHATLVAAADLDPVEATCLLDDLVTANFVRPLGGGRFAFRHRVIQEVAYETQLRDQRRRWHALVAAALEAQADPDRRAAIVAGHHERAGNTAAAASWYGRAAANDRD